MKNISANSRSIIHKEKAETIDAAWEQIET